MNSSDSPFQLDIKDLERDILLLEKTNAELQEILKKENDQDLRLVIVENEYAIKAKLLRRKQLREKLGLHVEDEFYYKRNSKESVQEESNIILETSFIKNEGIESKNEGVFL